MVLLDIHLTMVHKVQDGCQVTGGNILEKNEFIGKFLDYGRTDPENNDWVLCRVLLQESFEGDRAGGQDNLVSLDLFSVTGDGHVHEVIFIPQILESALDALLEIIPAKAELLICRTHYLLIFLKRV